MTSHSKWSRRDFGRRGALAAAGVAAAAAVGTDPFGGGVAEAAVAPTVSATNTALDGLSGWDVPKDWGGYWRAKLQAAKAGNGTAVCALAGDSVGFGYWSSNLFATSWFEQLRTKLTAVGGNGGSGFQSQAHTPSVIYNPNSGVPAYYRSVPGNVWSESAGWTPQVPPYIYGPGGGALMAKTNGATVSNYVVGSKLGVWYYDGGANFTVTIDGVKVGTVKVGTSYGPAHVVFDVPNGKVDVHSWTITGNYNATTGRGTSVIGVEGLSATGVRLDNFSFPGLFSRAYANQDDARSGTYAGGWRNPADLVIYELGGNDLSGQDPSYPDGTPPDVWAANVQTYLDGVMSNTYGGDATGQTDVVLLFTVANFGGDLHRLYSAYKSRALGIAQTYGAALLDLNAMFHGSWNAWYKAGYAGNQSDPTRSGTDLNHPSDAGATFIANQLAALVVSTS
ncbi:SGNH/GDSL hydrolase family protein [Jatrophihabitans sp. YIM 134969]